VMLKTLWLRVWWVIVGNIMVFFSHFASLQGITCHCGLPEN